MAEADHSSARDDEAATNDRFDGLVVDEGPTLDSALTCVFDIHHHEVRTYNALLDRPASTVAELSAELDRDRSNVNRSLATLREKGLARRERRLLDGGGHVYQYSATPLSETRELLHDTLDAWATTAHEEIETFEPSS